jgi:hypothetical protein
LTAYAETKEQSVKNFSDSDADDDSLLQDHSELLLKVNEHMTSNNN